MWTATASSRSRIFAPFVPMHSLPVPLTMRELPWLNLANIPVLPAVHSQKRVQESALPGWKPWGVLRWVVAAEAVATHD